MRFRRRRVTKAKRISTGADALVVTTKMQPRQASEVDRNHRCISQRISVRHISRLAPLRDVTARYPILRCFVGCAGDICRRPAHPHETDRPTDQAPAHFTGSGSDQRNGLSSRTVARGDWRVGSATSLNNRASP